MDSLHVLFSDEGHPVAIRKWSQEPFDDAVEYVRKSDLADLIAACNLALDWADANARWFDISTAPRDGTYILVKVKDEADRHAGRVFVSRISHDDDVALYPGYASGTEFLSHWTPLPPPPSTPPLPEPLERLGEFLRKVKGAHG